MMDLPEHRINSRGDHSRVHPLQNTLNSGQQDKELRESEQVTRVQILHSPESRSQECVMAHRTWGRDWGCGVKSQSDALYSHGTYFRDREKQCSIKLFSFQRRAVSLRVHLGRLYVYFQILKTF